MMTSLSYSFFVHVRVYFFLTLVILQTQNRMKLMADNYEDDHLKTAPDQTNHKPSPDQVLYVTTNYQLVWMESLFYPSLFQLIN